mmetsp:Transcript_10405/g.13520  ORF Transcript_10405/g.13520 Transcript_10405/m.13520 type:complete len:661 (-) Transcript_10405:245-2227(-)
MLWNKRKEIGRRPVPQLSIAPSPTQDVQIFERTPENMKRLGLKKNVEKKENVKTKDNRVKIIRKGGEKIGLLYSGGGYSTIQPMTGSRSSTEGRPAVALRSMSEVFEPHALPEDNDHHWPVTGDAGFRSMKGEVTHRQPSFGSGISSQGSGMSLGQVQKAMGLRVKPKQRLMDRDYPYHQTKGAFHVKRKGHKNLFATFYKADWFHTVVNFPMQRTAIIMSALYIGTVLFFAMLYTTISLNWPECEMEIGDLKDGFYFSLETMATIGYSTRDIFFGHCWAPLFTITFQAMVDILIECTIFGIIFARMSRAQTRAFTIHFSDKAIVHRRSDGNLHFSFRVCELRKHQLIEAHIRCYAIRHTLDEKGDIVEFFSSKYMRLQNPDDELGGFLLMVMPETITHRIDEKSPFMPPLDWLLFRGIRMRTDSGAVVSGGDSSSDEGSLMGVGGAVPLGDAQPLLNVLSSSDSPKATSEQRAASAQPEQEKKMEKVPSFPTSPSKDERGSFSSSRRNRRSFSGGSARARRFDKQTIRLLANSEQDLIQTYIKDSELEVVVLLEGIDAPTSCTVQARHSYKGNDIVWNQEFMPCVSRLSDGSCEVDFSKFHHTWEQSEEKKYPGYRKQTHKNVALKRGSSKSLARSASYTEKNNYLQSGEFERFSTSMI